MDGWLVSTVLVSERSDLMRWYAQLTGRLWLGKPRHAFARGGDGELLFRATLLAFEEFEQAFRQWRRLSPPRPKGSKAKATTDECEEGTVSSDSE